MKDKNNKTLKHDDIVLLPNSKLGRIIDIDKLGVTVESIASKQSFVYGSWELILIARCIKTMKI